MTDFVFVTVLVACAQALSPNLKFPVSIPPDFSFSPTEAFEPRIQAVKYQFPFYATVQLRIRGELQIPHCGGALVAPNFVLTSGLCCSCECGSDVDDQLSFEVNLNLYQLDPDGNPVPDQCFEDFTHAKRNCHPSYTAPGAPHDFCLLELTSNSGYAPATRYNSLVQKFSIRPDSAGYLLYTSGYLDPDGTVAPNEVISYLGPLQKSAIRVVPDDICKAYYERSHICDVNCMTCPCDRTFDATNLMCGNATIPKVHCAGDAGSPLFTKISGKYVQVGVLSGCEVGFAGVYGRLDTDSFKSWANSIIPFTNAPSSPSRRPSTQPTLRPTRIPTKKPSRRPTLSPTFKPTKRPTAAPTTKSPTRPSAPTRRPTNIPTVKPTKKPTVVPTSKPSKFPSPAPTRKPTRSPTTRAPTKVPTTRQPVHKASCVSNSF